MTIGCRPLPECRLCSSTSAAHLEGLGEPSRMHHRLSTLCPTLLLTLNAWVSRRACTTVMSLRHRPRTGMVARFLLFSLGCLHKGEGRQLGTYISHPSWSPGLRSRGRVDSCPPDRTAAGGGSPEDDHMALQRQRLRGHGAAQACGARPAAAIADSSLSAGWLLIG